LLRDHSICIAHALNNSATKLGLSSQTDVEGWLSRKPSTALRVIPSLKGL
jgi:hypothetical protein